jgi:hypothetical protein
MGGSRSRRQPGDADDMPQGVPKRFASKRFVTLTQQKNPMKKLIKKAIAQAETDAEPAPGETK